MKDRFISILKEIPDNQEDIAIKSGVSKQTITNIKNGQSKKINPKVLTYLQDEYGYNLSWIVNGTGSKKKYSELENAIFPQVSELSEKYESRSVQSLTLNIQSLLNTKNILIDEINTLKSTIRDKEEIINLLKSKTL